MTAQTNPWLYSEDATVFVFKFTIAIQGQPEQIMYQPTQFPAKAKALLIGGADHPPR